MRTVLIGAVGSTEIVLKAMQEAGHPPALLATLPPELGRRRHGDYVDLSALTTAETDVIHIDSSSDPAFIATIEDIAPDVLLVIGWSQIVGPALRSAARRHCVGFHPTLLPALRGRAAIGWTILLGLRETGASLFELGDGVDDGNILAQARLVLDERENVGSLAAKLSDALAAMIRDLLPRLAAGEAVSRPQPATGASYCARRVPADNLIDWRDDHVAIDRLIRASSPPYSGAFTFTRKRRLTIWSAEPLRLDHPYYAAPGQVVDYVEGDPVVRCGDGAFLRLTSYEAAGERLIGQVRFRDRIDEEE